MTVKQPIKQKVLEQLMTGEPIRCKAFAAKHHVAVSHVVQNLLALHAQRLVERIETAHCVGGRSVVYKPADMGAIRDELERVKGTNGKDVPGVDFTGLLSAWRIRLADIELLPTFRHELIGEAA